MLTAGLRFICNTAEVAIKDASRNIVQPDVGEAFELLGSPGLHLECNVPQGGVPQQAAAARNGWTPMQEFRAGAVVPGTECTLLHRAVCIYLHRVHMVMQVSS